MQPRRKPDALPSATLGSIGQARATAQDSVTFPHPPKHSRRSDTDSLGAVATLDAIDGLQTMSPLLLDEEHAERVFAELPPEQRLVTGAIVQHARRLRDVCRWTDEELLVRLGCDLKTVKDVSDAPLATLRNCAAFLDLLWTLTGLVDTVSDKRAVTMECAVLLKDVHRDAAGLGRLLAEGEPPGLELIRLGEISAAAAAARRSAGASHPWEQTSEELPYAAVEQVHLSLPRLDLYLQGDREALGHGVYDRITVHVEECGACVTALATRRRQLGTRH